MSRPLTAAQRTLSIPGVDVREQEDRAAVAEDGPPIRRAAFDGTLETTHYALVSGAEGKARCGRSLRSEGLRNLDKRVCLACRVEASRIGAVLR